MVRGLLVWHLAPILVISAINTGAAKLHQLKCLGKSIHSRNDAIKGLSRSKSLDSKGSSGGTGREQCAKEKVEYIMQNHKTQPLSAEVEAEINEILKRGQSTEGYIGD
jgi:hypothetical protein